MRVSVVYVLCVGCLWSALAVRLGHAETAALAAPPRTITDITALLDKEKPDPNLAVKMRAAAEAIPPPDAGSAALATFYYNRAQARFNIGMLDEAIDDDKLAIELGKTSVGEIKLGLMMQFLGFSYRLAGHPREAADVFLEIERSGTKSESRRTNTYRQLVELYIILGDLPKAEDYVRKAKAVAERQTATADGYIKISTESDAASAAGMLAEARGQYTEAEVFYARAETLRRQAALLSSPNAPSRTQQERAADKHAATLGWVKARSGRLAEGEIDIRRALLNRLRAQGKYTVVVAQHVGNLANLLVLQGRYAEADILLRSKIEIQLALGLSKKTQTYAVSVSQLASLHALQDRWDEASKAYGELAEVTRGWDLDRREVLDLTREHIATFYGTNQLGAGIAAAKRLAEQNKARFGEQHIETALTRGLLAIGLFYSGSVAEARREFARSIPALVSHSQIHHEADDDAISGATRERSIRNVIEVYLKFMTTLPDHKIDTEGFRLVDIVRGHSVEKALAESGARATARDPALAALIRRGQDLAKQVGAQVGLLNNILSSPTGRGENTIAALRATVVKLQSEHTAAQNELATRFPGYADLIAPDAPSVSDIQKVLKPDEAFISFYFGRTESFVWVVPQFGPVAFAVIPESAKNVDAQIASLREALEPNATLISDIPNFDVALAYKLYTVLLAPVAASWKPAKRLIVTTNGALGQFPIGLLPTAPSSITHGDEPLFAEYRKVPWLARTHAVTMVPSAAALRTLRQLPPSVREREPMIGFGDAIFNSQQLDDIAPGKWTSMQVASVTTRGLPLGRRAAPHMEGVDSVTLGMLPRLPDTAAELKSIAAALHADATKVLYLGKDANEDNVKNRDLSKYRVVVFATHGLTPGELDGLQEPALALTAPELAKVPGDGLLTLTEILALKLNADWVVLSACNSGAASIANAEAASGLGRAFFYAGARAILVTNWSVHSQSARELVTDLFVRQAKSPTLTRSEALREAMMSVMDGKGFSDEHGETLYTYAHPLFWAPYSIIGDGS